MNFLLIRFIINKFLSDFFFHQSLRIMISKSDRPRNITCLHSVVESLPTFLKNLNFSTHTITRKNIACDNYQIRIGLLNQNFYVLVGHVISFDWGNRFNNLLPFIRTEMQIRKLKYSYFCSVLIIGLFISYFDWSYVSEIQT